jgi:signal transduction histidine kinase
MHKLDEHIPLRPVKRGWRSYVNDSLLAIAGIALISSIIMSAHLYPHVPSIVLTFLLVVITLAYTRGIFAAILAALLASLSFDIVLTPPADQVDFITLYDLIDPDPLVYLTTSIIVGLLTAALHNHAKQARRRERETRLLSKQARELAVLQERQRLAHELHDSVSQTLYGISLGAHTAQEALDSNPGEAAAPLEYVINLTEAGLAEMRALIFELRPEALATEGIITALTKQIAVLRTRYKLSVDAQLDEEPKLSLENKQILYRIAQEALHNIVKHASASKVTLRLARQDGELILEVHDNGKGFDPTGPFPGHLGLPSIRERTARLGGTCSIESTPSQGTHLYVRIPTHNDPTPAIEKNEREIL